MSPIYIKMSKFPHVLLAFKFSKLLNKQEKLMGDKTHSRQLQSLPVGALVCGVSLATHYAAPMSACECLGMSSVGQLGHIKVFGHPKTYNNP